MAHQTDREIDERLTAYGEQWRRTVDEAGPQPFTEARYVAPRQDTGRRWAYLPVAAAAALVVALTVGVAVWRQGFTVTAVSATAASTEGPTPADRFAFQPDPSPAPRCQDARDFRADAPVLGGSDAQGRAVTVTVTYIGSEPCVLDVDQPSVALRGAAGTEIAQGGDLSSVGHLANGHVSPNVAPGTVLTFPLVWWSWCGGPAPIGDLTLVLSPRTSTGRLDIVTPPFRLAASLPGCQGDSSWIVTKTIDVNPGPTTATTPVDRSLPAPGCEYSNDFRADTPVPGALSASGVPMRVTIAYDGTQPCSLRGPGPSVTLQDSTQQSLATGGSLITSLSGGYGTVDPGSSFTIALTWTSSCRTRVSTDQLSLRVTLATDADTSGGHSVDVSTPPFDLGLPPPACRGAWSSMVTGSVTGLR